MYSENEIQPIDELEEIIKVNLAGDPHFYDNPDKPKTTVMVTRGEIITPVQYHKAYEVSNSPVMMPITSFPPQHDYSHPAYARSGMPYAATATGFMFGTYPIGSYMTGVGTILDSRGNK